MVQLQAHDVQNNLTGQGLHVEGPQISQINH